MYQNTKTFKKTVAYPTKTWQKIPKYFGHNIQENIRPNTGKWNVENN